MYKFFGEETDIATFDDAIASIDPRIKNITPLIFRYFGNQAKFGWHKHPPGNNTFQLLINLSEPSVDYSGGETLVWLGEDRPNEDLQSDKLEVFDARFGKGDLFSFPYTYWHMVKPVLSTASRPAGEQDRISLLMPLTKREGGAENEYLD